MPGGCSLHQPCSSCSREVLGAETCPGMPVCDRGLGSLSMNSKPSLGSAPQIQAVPLPHPQPLPFSYARVWGVLGAHVLWLPEHPLRCALASLFSLCLSEAQSRWRLPQLHVFSIHCFL